MSLSGLTMSVRLNGAARAAPVRRSRILTTRAFRHRVWFHVSAHRSSTPLTHVGSESAPRSPTSAVFPAGVAAGKKTPLEALKEENALLKETIADAEASVQEMTGELEGAGVDPSSKAPLAARAEAETPEDLWSPAQEPAPGGDWR